MTTFTRFAVIKTGWCDSYTGNKPVGSFSYFEKGSGAERFNMVPTSTGFEVYCITPPPRPMNRTGWTLAHVAIDPADRKMKLVGWYEDATFLGKELTRSGKSRGEDSSYCIKAKRAFQLLPANRPSFTHGHQLGNARIGWLRGEDTPTDWSAVRRKLQALIVRSKPSAIDQRRQAGKGSETSLGDTLEPAKSIRGIVTDDGGVPYGRSASAESEEHKTLKQWAYENPAFFGAPVKPQLSKPEFDLPSGDRVDAAHVSETGIWLIEVKSRRSGEKDIERGVYQCIKYKAVYEAVQAGIKNKLIVSAILLTEEDISDRLQRLAKRHRIKTLKHFNKANI